MLADLRFALRQLAKSPGFAAVTILSLALGIGANTAIFSLVNAVLLRSLPVKNPGELVLFRYIEGPRGTLARAGENNGFNDPATGRFSSTSFSIATFAALRANHPGLAEVFAFAPFSQITVAIDGQPEVVASGQYVSGNYHAGLGVSAGLGRTLIPDDDQPAAAPVAVISDRYWENRFARDPAVLGQTIQINQVPVTLVGVTPPGFAGAMQVGDTADISVPLALHARLQPGAATGRAQPWYWWIRIMGRLAPDANAAQTRANLEPLFQNSAREGWLAGRAASYATGDGTMPGLPALALEPGGQGENDTRRRYTPSLRVLVGLVGLVLLAACVNVANLLLARGAARRREIALRLALGASRGRVVRQLLAESLLLAFLGALLGAALACWSRGLLLSLRVLGSSPQTSAALDLRLDGRVLGFTVAITAATALLFGLAPALRATRVNLKEELQGGARTLGAGSRSRLSQSLMIIQIALSLVLLVGTGLFVRTLRNLQTVDPGFNPHQLVLFRVNAVGYADDQSAALHARLRERLERLPGVRAVTFSRVALLGDGRMSRRVAVPGTTPDPGQSPNINVNALAPNFLRAMEIPLLLGREFTDHDAASAPKVAIVNQAFARRFFGDESPLGRRIEFGNTPNASAASVEIVGGARDAKYTGLREVSPATIYLPAPQLPGSTANFALRVSASPASLIAAIQGAVREIDPSLPVINLRTQDEQIDRLNSQERLFAHLSGFFGAVALALACVGLYGLMSYQVLRRTGEIGLRMALGALPAQVLGLILRESLTLVGLGVLAGVALALGATRWLSSLLFGLSPTDPIAYGGSALLLLVVALVACLLPARRAAKIDPMVALRTE
jgi:predicted permease